MSDLEKRMQHREFVQNTITRMNSNSFQTKGLTITIVAAFLAIYGSNSKDLFLIIPIPFVFLFWFLDSYYLQQERRFVGIYNDICGLTENPITSKIYEINPKLYVNNKYRYFNVFFSKTIWALYTLIILGLTITYYIFVNGTK